MVIKEKRVLRVSPTHVLMKLEFTEEVQPEEQSGIENLGGFIVVTGIERSPFAHRDQGIHDKNFIMVSKERKAEFQPNQTDGKRCSENQGHNQPFFSMV